MSGGSLGPSCSPTRTTAAEVAGLLQHRRFSNSEPAVCCRACFARGDRANGPADPRWAWALGVQWRWEAVAVIVWVPLLWLARVLAAVVRDLLEALAAILYAIGRGTVGVLGIATGVLILYAILVRATVHVAMPAVVWLALAGAWLTAAALCLVGGALLRAARPRARRAYIRRGPGTPGVSSQRIQEWESAWRRALRYQEMGGRHADAGSQRASEHQRRDQPGGAIAGSPYEILGVKPGVNQEQLRAAYRELARRLHPDHNPGFVAEATERLAAINAAYELLSDPGRRAGSDCPSGGR